MLNFFLVGNACGDYGGLYTVERNDASPSNKGGNKNKSKTYIGGQFWDPFFDPKTALKSLCGSIFECFARLSRGPHWTPQIITETGGGELTP